MIARSIRLMVVLALGVGWSLLDPVVASAQSAATRYTNALARDEQVRSELVSEPG